MAQVRSGVGLAVAAGPRSRRFAATLLVAVLLLGLLVTVGGAAVHALFDGGGSTAGSGTACRMGGIDATGGPGAGQFGPLQFR